MIKTVILENWRSHERTEFHFRKGTNVLVGVMGSGKSSVMDAISFALFGTFPNLNTRKIKLDDIIMKKPVKKNYAAITLIFEYNGDEYTISRKIERKKGTTEVSLRKNGSLVEVGAARVNEFLNELLKIDYDLFSRAVYSEQNKIDYFLQIPKGQRKQKIDELLRINKFEEARKNLGSLIKRLNDRLEEKKKMLKPVDEREIESLKKEVSELNQKINEKKRELEALSKTLNEKKEEYSKIEALKRKFEELSKELERIKGRKISLEEKIRGLVVRENIEDLVREKKKELEEAIRKKEEYSNLQNTLNSKKELVEKDLRKIEELKKEMPVVEIDVDKEILELEKKTEELNEEKSRKQSRIGFLENRIKELKESISKLDSDTCPVCDSPLSPEKREILKDNKNKEILRIENEKKDLSKEIENILKEIEIVNKRKKEIEKLMRKLDKKKFIDSQIREIEKEVEKLKEEIEEIEEKLKNFVIKDPNQLMKELEELNKELEAKKMMEELAFLNERKEFLEKELGSIDYSEDRLKELSEDMKIIEIKINTYRVEINSDEILLKEKEVRLGELLKMKEEYEKEVKIIEGLSRYINSFKILESVLKDVQIEIRNEFTKTLNTALHDLWNNFYPYGDYVSLRLGIDEDGDYILQLLENNGNWINVEGITSGGERSSACLCLRIAMALVLTQNLSWIILDEPTHNIDKNGIKELARILREHLPQIVEQIFVITHEDELENAATGSLYRLERDKEKNEPTRAIVEILEE